MSTAELDSCYPHGLGMAMPAGAGSALREAAAMHQLALAPSPPADCHRVLLGLRGATIIRREGEGEADASLKMLRVHLQDVPLDVLQAACHAYCNAPGQRFFPRSAGELRTFINPLLYERQARAFRLRWLADRADEQDAERERLEQDPLTPEMMEAIKEQYGLQAEPVLPLTRDPYRPPRIPTAADYAALGVAVEGGAPCSRCCGTDRESSLNSQQQG